MSFKKTITFTATVSDYTDGTVSARVQAENKILGDFITWLLSHNLNLSVQERIEIGSSQWAGKPLYCSTSGYTGVASNSTTTDFYIIGKGKAKKCLGFSVDQHRLFFGLTDTVEKDLSYSMSSDYERYGRIPAVQMRRDTDQSIRDNKIALTDQIWGWNFSQSDNVISLNVSYWKSENALAVLIDNDGNTSYLVLSKDPSTCFYAFNKELQGLHFSFDDDFLINDATYSFAAINTNYSSNIYLGYAMSYNPFFARQSSSPMVEPGVTVGRYPTCILCHIVGATDNQINALYSGAIAKISQPQNGLSTASYMPMQTGFGFPRIANNELYIRKMYVPMTYPAVVSPLKVGYTPGTLRAGTVYSLADKYYLCLTNGVIGHFVEVADQG